MHSQFHPTEFQVFPVLRKIPVTDKQTFWSTGWRASIMAPVLPQIDTWKMPKGRELWAGSHNRGNGRKYVDGTTDCFTVPRFGRKVRQQNDMNSNNRCNSTKIISEKLLAVETVETSCSDYKYLHSFELDRSPNCPSCDGSPENPEHDFFHCLRFLEERKSLEKTFRGTVAPESLVEKMLAYQKLECS